MNCVKTDDHVSWETGLWVLALQISFSVIIASGLYCRYGSFAQRPWWCSILVIISWTNTLLVMFMITNDLQSTAYKNCIETQDMPCIRPLGLVAWQTLLIVWRVQYVLGIILSSIICPFMMNYTHSPQFSIGKRLLDALKKHTMIYGSMLVIIVAGLSYIAIKHNMDWNHVEGVIAAVTLTWTMCLFVCFLGIGLERIPRKLWHMSILQRNLNYFQYRASELTDILEEARHKLNRKMKILRKIDLSTNQYDPRRLLVDVIIDKCLSYYSVVNQQDDGSDDLIELHEKIMRYRSKLEKTQVLLHNNYDQAFEQEDIVCASKSGIRQISWQFRRAYCTPIFEYFWYVFFKPYILKICSITSAMLSLIIIWSEMIFWTNGFSQIPSLTPFFYIAKYASNWLIFGLVGYIMICAFSSLFKLRLFDYYHMMPHQQTDTHSLLFSAAWMGRLILPIAYNILPMFNRNVDPQLTCIHQTAFDTIFLHIGSVAYWLALFLPLGIGLVVALSFFDLHKRIMTMFNINFFNYTDIDDEHLVCGRELIDRERSRRCRDVV